MYEQMSPEQRKQLNELLSMTTIRSDGTIDGQPNATLAALMGPQTNPQYQEPEMPQNYFQRGNNAPVALGQSGKPVGDPWVDGPQVLEQRQLSDGRVVKRMKVPAWTGDGRQSTAIEEVIEVPDYMNPAKLKELKYKQEYEKLTQKPETTYDKEFAKRKAEADAVNLMAKTPGTKEWKAVQKQAATDKKQEGADAAALEGAIQKGNLLLGPQNDKGERSGGAIDKAMKQADSWLATGLTGQVLRNVGGTDAFKLEQTINPIKANLGFDELAKMRAASPTGGALGQIAVKELEFLQSAVASLDTAQDAEQLKQNLQAVKTHYNNWISNQIRAKQAGELTSNQDQPRGAPVPIRSEAEANSLPKGTVVIINGRRAVVE
jgi:hypothetical protein